MLPSSWSSPAPARRKMGTCASSFMSDPEVLFGPYPITLPPARGEQQVIARNALETSTVTKACPTAEFLAASLVTSVACREAARPPDGRRRSAPARENDARRALGKGRLMLARKRKTPLCTLGRRTSVEHRGVISGGRIGEVRDGNGPRRGSRRGARAGPFRGARARRLVAAGAAADVGGGPVEHALVARDERPATR